MDENATADDGSTLLYAWKDTTEGSEDYLKVSAVNMEGMTLDAFLEVVKAQMDPEAEIVELAGGISAVIIALLLTRKEKGK